MLTTASIQMQLFVFSIDDIGTDSREFFRFLHCSERFALQGFDPPVAELLPNETLRVKAKGNAYTCPMVGAAVNQLIDCLAKAPPPPDNYQDLAVALAEARRFKLPRMRATHRKKSSSRRGLARPTLVKRTI